MGTTRRKISVASESLKVRIPHDLKWRVEYFADHQHQTISAAIRILLLKALGPMGEDEEVEFKRHLKAFNSEDVYSEPPAIARPTVAVVERPEPVSSEDEDELPDCCPACGERKVPVLDDPIWMINTSQRNAICNNCGHRIYF